MSKNTNKPFARIGLVAAAEYRYFLTHLVREIKDRRGSEIHLICQTPETKKFYQQIDNSNLFDSITVNDVIQSSYRHIDLDDKAVFARAIAYEEQYGFTFNGLALTNRHLGRGYALGGFHHPRSRESENTSYVQMVHTYSEQISFWENFFREKKLTMLLNGDRIVATLCRDMGIRFRQLAVARLQNRYHWAWNEYSENPEIDQLLKSEYDFTGVELDAPYLGHSLHKKDFIKTRGLAYLGKNLAYTLASRCWWKMRGYAKAKTYYMLEELRYFIRDYRQWRKLNAKSLVSLMELENKKFVYYPMHIEPELALQALSPEYFYQLSLIAAVSRDLPAGVYLAVKEYYSACGQRPSEFYDQICEFKNVVMLDPIEPGIECAKRADAVVTICGTGGFEAAFFGRPVIAFGRHNPYNALSHVWPVEDEIHLKRYLQTALDSGFDRCAAAKEGRRLAGAMHDCSFDMGDYYFGKPEDVPQESIREAYTYLVKSLRKEDEGLRLSPSVL